MIIITFWLTLRILAIRMKYRWWAILCFCITRWTIGMKIVNFGPICITMAHSVSMAAVCNSGTESKVLTRGWMIREANSVRSRVKVNLSTVSKAILKIETRDYNVLCDCIKTIQLIQDIWCAFKEIINIRFFFLFIYALTFWLREGHLGCQTASPQEGEVDGGSHQG